MMSKEQKKQLLKMAISCLRQEGETRPIFSKETPTKDELKMIKQGLIDGDIDEAIIEKFFPVAHRGVEKYGFFEHFFYHHNKEIMGLPRYAVDEKLVRWCTAHPGKVIEKTDSQWIVEIFKNGRITVDQNVYPGIKFEDEIKPGSYVIIHRGKIPIVLDKEKYEEAVSFYSKFLKEFQTK